MGRLPLLVLLAATSARAAEFPRIPTGPSLLEDPLLRVLVQQAMDKRPELAQAHAQIAAEHGARAPEPSLA